MLLRYHFSPSLLRCTVENPCPVVTRVNADIDKSSCLSMNSCMRFFFLALFCLLSAACSTTKESVQPAVKIVGVVPRYIETEQFKRISEYMTGKENPGRRVIIRTDSRQRDGYYFVLTLDRNVQKLPSDIYIEGEFYTSKSLDLQTHSFEFPSILPNTREIFIGLTGDDWPEKEAIPAAWRFTIRNSQEEILAQEQSYLWSL
jgi:hypothetical protein